ncbi:hypothetical protein BV455_01397 [Parageobacillus caldoxylosilyticus]|nr:hypothetical protein BV455_01397 [Parageobacillus caldoxylosilyticus]
MEDVAEAVVVDIVLAVAVDIVLAVVLDIVLAVVSTALVALAASIAGGEVLAELSSPLAQKGDYLRRMDCPCVILCRGPAL